MKAHRNVIAWVKACGATLLLASPIAAERLIIRTYSVVDGLPSDRIVCLVTDRDGFLWVCTSGGLSRFDGSQFATYGTAHGLPDPVVNHFLQTRSGSRWVAMNGGGVARLEPGAPGADGRIFEPFQVGSTPRSMRVNILFETRDGSLLAGTDRGLFRARQPDAATPQFERVSLALPGFSDSGLQVWGIAEDSDGRIWIGTSGGLVLLRGARRLAHIHVAPAQSVDHVFDIVLDATGRLWLGHDTGVFVWNPRAGGAGPLRDIVTLIDRSTPCLVSRRTDGAAAVELPDAPGSVCHWAPGGERHGLARVQSLHQADDGWIWMASRAGLAAFDGARFRVFDASHGLPVTLLRSVAVGPGGDVWVGSAYSGLHRIQRRGFTYYTAEDGLVGPVSSTILSGRDGHLYIVSTTAVIHRFEGDRWTAVRPNLPAPVGRLGRSIYSTALIDREGAWWIGTGVGLVRFPPVSRLEALATTPPLATYTIDDGLAGNDIRQLFEDSRGDIWISTRIPGPEPLTRWERTTGRFQRFGPADGLPAERSVGSVVEHPSGTLWVSFWDGGVARFDGHRFQYFAPGEDVPPGNLYKLLVDRRGWLWVPGRETFFSRDPTAPHPRFETFRHADGQAIMAFALIDDREGWIYAQTFTGLLRFRADDGRVQQLGFGRPFTKFETRFHRDAEGTLWLLRDDGVLRYEPRPLLDGDPPRVRIAGVRVAGEPVPVPPLGATRLAPLSLDADQRQVRFDYFGLGFGAVAPLRFQVRLDGVDDEWGDPTSQSSVLYGRLGSGSYRFQVRAVSATGRVSAEPATVDFRILPPFWRRAWFLAAVTALLAAALFFVYRLRVRRVRDLERIRTRIAADLHDDLGASLARVSLLSAATRRTLRERPEHAERMLHEIGTTSRELVTAAGDIAFSIDPGRSRLDALVARLRRFTEDLLADTGIDWRFTVDGEMTHVVLSSDQRRHLLAIVKEALHNAVRHARPRHLSLTLALQGDVLEAELADDGCGFRTDVSGNGRKPQASNGREPPSSNGRGAQAGRNGRSIEAGHGLRNMRDRAHELGGRLEIASHPGGGTRVTLRCPLRPRHRMAMR